MRLVDSTSSPFTAVGSGPQTGNLTCVTAAVCFAQGPNPAIVEVTKDGGQTWQPVAALPGGAALQWPMSCPSTAACFAIASGGSSPLMLASSTDLGSTWQLETIPAPAGFDDPAIAQLSCATTTDCVLQLTGSSGSGQPLGTFMSTSDGGDAWSVATSVPPEGSTPAWELRCDQAGSCISLAVGPVTPDSGTIETLTSSDGGTDWTETSSVLPIGKGVLLFSCGDASHCIAAFPSGPSAALTLATTSDAGATWKVSTAASSWPSIAISLSCATGLDCFLSAGDSGGSGYDDAAIEATHDGGATWAPLSLPLVDGAPLAIVYPLSCPVAAGCVGVGATPAEFGAAAGTTAAQKAPRRTDYSRFLKALKCSVTGTDGATQCHSGSLKLVCRSSLSAGSAHCQAALPGGAVLVAQVQAGHVTGVLVHPVPGASARPASAGQRVIISNLPG
jgi:photosystem II stability/assembly factor-like uncharacterized protein